MGRGRVHLESILMRNRDGINEAMCMDDDDKRI